MRVGIAQTYRATIAGVSVIGINLKIVWKGDEVYHRDWGIISEGWYCHLDSQSPVDLRQ